MSGFTWFGDVPPDVSVRKRDDFVVESREFVPRGAGERLYTATNHLNPQVRRWSNAFRRSSRGRAGILSTWCGPFV